MSSRASSCFRIGYWISRTQNQAHELGSEIVYGIGIVENNEYSTERCPSLEYHILTMYSLYSGQQNPKKAISAGWVDREQPWRSEHG